MHRRPPLFLPKYGKYRFKHTTRTPSQEATYQQKGIVPRIAAQTAVRARSCYRKFSPCV